MNYNYNKNYQLNKGNKHHYYGTSDTFWSRHSLVVAIDASEILDRVFCKCGLVAIFQVRMNYEKIVKLSIFHEFSKLSRFFWQVIARHRQIESTQNS